MFAIKPCDPGFLTDAKNIKRFDLIINAPAGLVFDVVSGKDEHLWFPNFVSMRWIGNKERCAGSLREYKLKGLTIQEYFTVWEPSKRLEFYLTAMSIPYCSRFMEHYAFDPIDSNTTALTWQICYEPSWMFWPVFFLVRLVYERDLNRAAENLCNYFLDNRLQ
jgi:hypothetical protein